MARIGGLRMSRTIGDLRQQRDVRNAALSEGRVVSIGRHSRGAKSAGATSRKRFGGQYDGLLNVQKFGVRSVAGMREVGEVREVAKSNDEAFRVVIAHAHANNAAGILIPRGQYAVTAPVTVDLPALDNTFIIRGVDAVISAVPGANTRLHDHEPHKAVLHIVGAKEGSDRAKLVVSDLRLDGQRAARVCLWCDGVDGANVVFCRVAACASLDTGILINNSRNVVLERVESTDHQANAIELIDSAQTVLRDISVEACGGIGLNVRSGGVEETSFALNGFNFQDVRGEATIRLETQGQEGVGTFFGTLRAGTIAGHTVGLSINAQNIIFSGLTLRANQGVDVAKFRGVVLGPLAKNVVSYGNLGDDSDIHSSTAVR